MTTIDKEGFANLSSLLMNIQLRHIKSFIVVAQEKSFCRAAELLNVSQPALSQTIIQLETNAGFPLFTRTTRAVSLTPFGEQMLTKALAVSRSMDLFQEEARRVQLALKSELRVGFMIGTAVEFIPAIVKEFERVRPDAILKLKEYDFSDPTAGLISGEVDCGIIRPPIGDEDINIVEITREKCVVCLPTGHPLAAKETVVLADILDEPLIGAPTPGQWRDYWLAGEYRDAQHPAQVVLEVATVESELQAVAMGRAISITADSTARYYARPGVVFRDITDMRECIIGIGHRGSPTALMADFIDVVRRISSSI
ncbi:LysR family transcriptional regulator [Shinella oryzae]|jgi:DNA-binding transcriptional LysR family regulator|uniref:LysR family transcriptional regulator n=2 Tax=Shinella TaxID=323620 RepID=UPI001FF6A266|nr:LysR family transcriptional regulator [Shinella oryzae]UPA27706.1 LysR family transcriptional regulator [Shinella oryzae]